MTTTANPSGTWIRRFHPAGEQSVQLVCLPHAGGSAGFFFPLSKALAPAVQVLAVQYPGRQDRYREPCIDSIPELADRVFEAVSPSAGRPLAFFGHSMGAVIAYEVALRMRRAGMAAPVRLFASGRRAPSRYREEAVHRRSDAGVVAELRRLSGTHASVLADPEMLSLILPAVRSDYRAIETYRHNPDEILDCPITVLVGDRDPMVTLEEARDWQRHTIAPVDLHVFDGGHFFLIDQAGQVVELVAEKLAGAA